MAAKAAIRYAVVDAFTDRPFKGNPAVVCFLPDDEERDVEWMKSVVMEFNLPMTVFLSHDTDPEKPRFRLRWFTPAREVDLCGHGTMAAAHFLRTSGISNSDAIEFVSRFGHLTAKRIPELKNYGTLRLSENGSEENSFIELDFPAVPVIGIESPEIPSFPKTLKGANIINMCKTAIDGDLIVELATGQEVVNIQPDFDEIQNCPTRAIIITGAAPDGSGFDFFSRVFAPKLGINEVLLTTSKVLLLRHGLLHRSQWHPRSLVCPGCSIARASYEQRRRCGPLYILRIHDGFKIREPDVNELVSHCAANDNGLF